MCYQGGDILEVGLFQNLSVGYQEPAGGTSKPVDIYKPDTPHLDMHCNHCIIV